MAAINNEIIKNIRLIAIDNVRSNSIDWYIEQAYRHYSKTYHTPLAQALKINPVEIIRIYQEDELQAMSPEDVEALEQRLRVAHQPMLDTTVYDTTEEDEGLDDDAWVAQQIAEAERREKESKNKPAPKSNPGPSMADAAKQAQQAIQGLYKQLNKPMPTDEDGEIKFESED